MASSSPGGVHEISGPLYLGYSLGSSGSYTLSGGTLLANQVMGGAGTSTFNFNGGLLQASASANSQFIVGLTNAYVQSGGANIDTNGQSIEISQPLLDGGGGGGLVKNGLGTLALTGSSTYTGPTSIDQGELQVNGSLASPVTVNSGGTLGGTGYLSSVTVSQSGQIAPGDAPGTLTIGGSLILATGAILDYALDTPSTSDMIFAGSLASTVSSSQTSTSHRFPVSRPASTRSSTPARSAAVSDREPAARSTAFRRASPCRATISCSP